MAKTSTDYETWLETNGIKDKGVFETAKDVRDKFTKSRDNLRQSCFWDAYQENAVGTTYSGGSWFERRTLQKKMALMWYRRPQKEDFASNIKAPMVRGRINTFVNWMKRLNIEFGARPNNKEDQNAAILADKTINYWMRNSDMKSALSDAWEECAIHGNGFLKLSYVREYGEYRFPKTDPKKLSKDEKKEVDDGKKKIVYTAPEKHLVVDDMVLEHIPIDELFQDPMGRNLHGSSYRCDWIIRRRYVTKDYLSAVFGDHPNVQYLNKVKPVSAYRDLSDYFFEPPTDYQSDEVIELLEYENQASDRHIVVANDIPIIDEPLPFNHKELSYHKLDFIRIPGQYFSMGISDLLDNIQSAYEIALNMVADYVYRTYNYKLLVESDNYGELQQALQRSDDMFVAIDASDGKPLNSKIMPLPPSQIGFDIFSFLKVLEEQATLATNIDPAQMAQLAGSKTATSDMLNKELLMTLIGGVIDTNTNGDLRQVGRQAWKVIQQMYTKPRVKKIVGDEKEVEKTRTLRFDGIELTIDPDTKLFVEREVEDADYSFFELKGEYLSTKEEIDVFIKPESTEVSSRAMEEQRMSEEFAQMIPFAVDPNNIDQVMNHMMPMVDANGLFKEYYRVKRLPQDLLLDKDGDNSAAAKKAEQHVTSILKGDHVQAIPGQSEAHTSYEYQVLDALEYQMTELEEELMEDMTKQAEQLAKETYNMPQYDPYTGQPIPVPEPIPNEEIQRKLDKVTEKANALKEHLVVETMPASMRQSRAAMMQKAQKESQQAEQQAPMPMESAGPQITPDMINPENPAGAVPMTPPNTPPAVNPLVQGGV